ncbi:SCO family protein [Glaciecola sp. MH2013]|uniref:SCO family protein n=1 Tax=Glaciecola sp. MH2013 TaxID=2785524 RepID=UPI0018A09046|nr:SCO family protein [Glaciecola sp. MH2013]MBF7074420.1 SCO family protein [Glaciecola sp. MH2013]
MNQNKLVGLVALVTLVLGVYLAVTIAPPSIEDKALNEQTKYMSWYPQARALSEFELTDHRNNTMTNADLTGKWTLAFVGYTFCPDICPVTLSEVNKIYPELVAQQSNTPLQIWFLSVDPKRDTTERLNEYVNFFNADFVASTGSHDQLFPLVRSMGMMYSMSESSDNPNYLVDHSASIVVINPDGNVVGRFKPKLLPGELAISDMEELKADVPVLLQNG